MAAFERIPKIRQLSPVYAVIVLMIYTWTILWFFWKLSGWLFYLEFDEILTILAYTITINLIESLIVLLAVLVVDVLLPKSWFYDRFVARGSMLAVSSLGYLMYVAYQFQQRAVFPQAFIARLTIPVFFLILSLVFISGRWGVARKIMEELADRATVFLYLSIPISIVSLLTVIVRNLI